MALAGEHVQSSFYLYIDPLSCLVRVVSFENNNEVYHDNKCPNLQDLKVFFKKEN